MNRLLLFIPALMALMFFVSCQEDDTILPPDDEPLIWTIELDGVDADLSFGQIALQNEDTLITLPLDTLQSDLPGVEMEEIATGEYTITISLFNGENLHEEGTNRKRYKGSEAVGKLTFTETAEHYLIKGPEGAGLDYQLEPEWSFRNFQTYQAESVPPMTISFPQEICEFDIRFVPDHLSRQPGYSYIDYVVYQEGEDPTSLGISECFGTCDIREQIGSFEGIVDVENRNLCSSNSWDLIDTIIMLNFGASADEFVIFYQRWDENGEVIMP